MPTPVLRAETYYLPPQPRRGQPAEDWSQVPGAELVYRWIDLRLGRRTPVPTAFVPDGAPVYARIDDNRWLSECDVCRNACLISLVDLRFGCTECLRDWVPLIIPADTDAAEAEAMQEERRFWWHPDDPRNPDRAAAAALKARGRS